MNVASKTGFILGIIAIVTNSLFFTIPIGIVCAFASIGFSLYALSRYQRGHDGLVASAISLVIVIIWLLSVAVPMIADETFRW